jgi:hypothetical protein
VAEKSHDEKRLSFGHFVDKAFWFITTTCALYISSQFKVLTDNVADLNVKVAVILTKIADAEVKANQQDSRLERLEGRFYKQK